MPAHPDLLRRLWWKSPLAARLLPAAALLTATGASVAGALPATQTHEAAMPPPPVYAAPATTEPAPTTTPEPEPTPTPTSSTTQTTTKRTTTAPRSTTTTRPAPPPPVTTSREEQPTTSREEAPPVVHEGQKCDQEGEYAPVGNGEPARCTRDDDGELRWTTRW